MSGKGPGTSEGAVGVQHWDPEEGTVCPFGSAAPSGGCISILVSGGHYV